MRNITSKLIRIYNQEKLPSVCYFLQYLPDSLSETCDCKFICKFFPKSNTETVKLKPKYKQEISVQFLNTSSRLDGS